MRASKSESRPIACSAAPTRAARSASARWSRPAGCGRLARSRTCGSRIASRAASITVRSSRVLNAPNPHSARNRTSMAAAPAPPAAISRQFSRPATRRAAQHIRAFSAAYQAGRASRRRARSRLGTGLGGHAGSRRLRLGLRRFGCIINGFCRFHGFGRDFCRLQVDGRRRAAALAARRPGRTLFVCHLAPPARAEAPHCHTATRRGGQRYRTRLISAGFIGARRDRDRVAPAPRNAAATSPDRQ